MRLWELEGQLPACSASIKLQPIWCNFLPLWALPVQHRFQSAPWNRQGMLLQVLIKSQKYWNAHENSSGLFPSLHEVAVEKALNTAPRADSWLPAPMCLDSLNHSKCKVYRIAPFKSVRLDQDLLQEIRIKWLPQMTAEGWPEEFYFTQKILSFWHVFILNLEMRSIFSIILEGMRKYLLSRFPVWTTFGKSVLTLLQRLEAWCPL